MASKNHKSALIIGGNRFFGKALARLLLKDGYQLTLLNRGNCEDGLGDSVERLICDRTDTPKMKSLAGSRHWDIVFDQICFDYDTAVAASDLFQGKVDKYVFTSSQSVYDVGSGLKEQDFQVEEYEFEEKHSKESHYQEAKRQAERGFFEKADFPVAFARLSIVLGPDDHTGRLNFHVEKGFNDEPVHFSSLDARLSMIHSDQAAEVLKAIGESDISGAVNVTCEEPMALSEFVREVEKVCGKPLRLSDEKTDSNHSPYGIHADWFMDTSKLREFCPPLNPVRAWLPALLKEISSKC